MTKDRKMDEMEAIYDECKGTDSKKPWIDLNVLYSMRTHMSSQYIYDMAFIMMLIAFANSFQSNLTMLYCVCVCARTLNHTYAWYEAQSKPHKH